jgi:hypothetical protein
MLFPKFTVLSLTALFCAGFASTSPAQGGWRQWEVRLRDGRRVEASPLGALDDDHLSVSVGTETRPERRLARSQVQALIALPFAGESLPPVPTYSLCEDAIVWRDGTTTIGRVTLMRVRWSEGVVAQRGDTINLRDVAYVVFATRRSGGANCRRQPPRHEPNFTFPCTPYTVGVGQMQRPCSDDPWT